VRSHKRKRPSGETLGRFEIWCLGSVRADVEAERFCNAAYTALLARGQPHVDNFPWEGRMSEIGHNSRGSLAGAADANIETGVLLLCKEFLVTAISDRRLDRTHLRVLACMVNFVNRKTAKAWPDRRTIAEALGVEPVTVSNKLLELRKWGYLIGERERVEEANNRSLMVYTFGNVDHDTIRREIEAYIERIRNPKVTEDGDYGEVTEGSDYRSKSPDAVTSKSPGAVTVTEGGDYQEPKVTEGGGRKSPSTVDSNSEKEPLPSNVEKLTTVGDASPPAQPSREEASQHRRGTRLADGWLLPKPWGEWAIEHFDVTASQVRAEAERFRDHWHSKSGKDATKIDWLATWRNWCSSSYTGWKRKKVDAGHAPDLVDTKPKRMPSRY
jgi:DNA-binding transcriptional regulator YhcF (GntR family)